MNKIWKIQNAIPLHYVRNYAFILLNNCSKLNWNSGFHYSQFQTLKYYSTDLTRKESEYDIVIVGGGIIGTASARELLLRNSGLKIAIPAHQSGHNSGVLHAGIYYKPGSLKAKLCVEGIDLSYKYYDEEGIPYKKLGKLIVATDKSEIPRLLDLHERALKNNVPGIKLIDGHQIKEHEPYCKGVKALWSPQTGIVDFELVTKHYGKNVVDRGGKIHLNFEVTGFESVAESQIGSKRGNEYPIRVKGKGDQVPDPRFPFLGVHFTPRMNGDIWLGPNALLALKREGYKEKDCQTGSRILHCRNAPSPGATSSLAIAKMIANKLHEEFDI
ncbi:L-2-hydroxyglutarate dehydrogenase, mitochondrial, partial [Armadillidium vulgare]